MPELPSVKQPVADIVHMSSGVFLWITLVVRSLLKSLTNQDKISDLRLQLRGLPPELDDLFSQMFDGIEPAFYIEQGSRFLQIVYRSSDQISALELLFTEENDEACVIEARINDFEAEKLKAASQALRGRVNSRTAGLLEI